MKREHQVTGHIAAIVTCLIWGTTFVSTKVLLQDFGPVDLLFLRFLLGYFTLWLMRPKKLRTEKGQEIIFVGAGLCGVCLYYLFENIALTYTQASNVSVIVSTAPLFVTIMAHFFLKEEKLQKYFFFGFVCAIAGIILLSFGGGENVSINLIGDLLCVAGSFVWGAYSILIKKISGFGYNVIQTTRRVFFYGLMFMIPILIGSGAKFHSSAYTKPLNLANLLYLGIGACAVCFVTWNYAVKMLGAIKTSAYIYAIPVITIVVSVIILHEKVTPFMLGGTALTVLGLVISEKK